MIDSTNTSYYTYTNNIVSSAFNPVRIVISCTSTSTTKYTFSGINFYTTGDLPKTDCLLTDWANNGSCRRGSQLQSRSIKTPALNGGISCSTFILTNPLSRNISCWNLQN